MDPAIAVTGLHKAFGERPVLRSVDLQVARGELLGVVGPNGAGKSTLFRVLLGLVPKDRGEVRVLGLDPATAAIAIRTRTCYLPGENGSYLQMTGREFLAYAFGFRPTRDDARLARLQDGFALPLQQKVRSYSAGMKQKLLLLGSLVPDVDLYVLDEPDRALDASVRFFVRDELRTMRTLGKTIVLSSHHLGEVEALADRLEFLLDGTFVPSTRLAAARAALRHRPRIRLRTGAVLPLGAREVAREPDGTLVVATDGDPMAWLRTVPDGTVDSAEVGIPRLEDLYQVLLAQQGAAP
ncbi:MAG: ABC transporter ATP-binding protein [Planctomycetes bacterium]|nr:ABC transporter ATP-binding protein [Planctomycetota bacterium]